MSERTSNRRRILSGASAIALALFFLTNPLTNVLGRGGSYSERVIALRGFAAPLHMALMVATVFGITELLRRKADLAGLIGGTLVVMGWAAGIRIIGFGQLESLIPAGTLRTAFAAAPLVPRSIIPMGILFPIGLITLGLTIVIARPIPRPIGALLALGGLLFPIGRIGQLGWAYTGADLALGLSFALIGYLIFVSSS